MLESNTKTFLTVVKVLSMAVLWVAALPLASWLATRFPGTFSWLEKIVPLLNDILQEPCLSSTYAIYRFISSASSSAS